MLQIELDSLRNISFEEVYAHVKLLNAKSFNIDFSKNMLYMSANLDLPLLINVFLEALTCFDPGPTDGYIMSAFAKEGKYLDILMRNNWGRQILELNGKINQ